MLRIDVADVKRTKWHEYAVRFLFGGAVSVAAALLGRRFGPHIGGLFLAFPAVLPASITLVSEHEGRKEASENAEGAACGAVGLAAFAVAVWQIEPRAPTWVALVSASAIWIVVSLLCWRLLCALKKRGSL